MASWQGFDVVGGFTFDPAGIISKTRSRPLFGKYKGTFLFLVMISVIQGIAAFYMIFYPEPLYYGLGPSTPHAHLFVIEQSNPLLLAGLIVVLLFINIGYFHGILGSLNFLLAKVLSRNTIPAPARIPRFREAMLYHGYGFMPLLLTVPVAAFRFFFFGRIAFNNHDFPFFDMTLPNLFYLVLLGGAYAWMFVVHAKVNRALFDGLGWRASIPSVVMGLVTVLVLVAIAVVLPPVLNDIVYTIIDE